MAKRYARRLTSLRNQFDAQGLRPSVRRGQNFLLDVNQAKFIAGLGEPGPTDVVLEVGPGTGFLTRWLAESGALVLAVELDHGVADLFREATKNFPNVFLLVGDILDGKNAINPAVEERVRELLAMKRKQLDDGAVPGAEGASVGLKCVSNLPYSAGTPFVMNLFRSPLPWACGVFLLQYEVTQRLTAEAGQEAYGALSIGARLAGRATIARKVPPQVFWPRPKVDSGVLKYAFRPPEERATVPWVALRRVVAAAFGGRRKRLRNALKGCFAGLTEDDALARAGIDGERRGETLSPDEFIRLAHLVDLPADKDL